MSLQESGMQMMLLNVAPAQQSIENVQTHTEKPNVEFHPSAFVQGKVEFFDNGDHEVVLERVPAATVIITTMNETGGFDTEIIIAPDR